MAWEFFETVFLGYNVVIILWGMIVHHFRSENNVVVFFVFFMSISGKEALIR